MHNPKGGAWGSTKRKLRKRRKKKKREKKQPSQSLLNCLDEAFLTSKRRRDCAPRFRAKPSMPGALKRISSRNSKMISLMFAPRWKSSPRRIPPSNWKAKPTIYMKSSAPKSPRGRKAGAQKANWIWIPSVHSQNKQELTYDFHTTSCGCLLGHFFGLLVYQRAVGKIYAGNTRLAGGQLVSHPLLDRGFVHDQF